MKYIQLETSLEFYVGDAEQAAQDLMAAARLQGLIVIGCSIVTDAGLALTSGKD